MFLQNKHSFMLVRSVILKPVIRSDIEESETSLPLSSSANFGATRLLPNKQSFLLTKSIILEPVIQSDIILESDIQFDIEESETSLPSSSSDSGKSTIVNKDKRTFLKAAGIASASVLASLFLPKKADALIMGSSPTTGVVGVKDSTNARINPATEGTLDKVLKTTDLDFDGSGYLNVNVQTTSAGSSSSFSDSVDVDKKGLVDGDRHVQVDVLSSALPTTASTETTLQTIAFGGKQYALKMTTVGSVDYIAEATAGTPEATNVWRVKKVDSISGIVITWADGNENFDNSAVDLPGLTYS